MTCAMLQSQLVYSETVPEQGDTALLHGITWHLGAKLTCHSCL